LCCEFRVERVEEGDVSLILAQLPSDVVRLSVEGDPVGVDEEGAFRERRLLEVQVPLHALPVTVAAVVAEHEPVRDRWVVVRRHREPVRAVKAKRDDVSLELTG
jgi:hypothetical protein